MMKYLLGKSSSMFVFSGLVKIMAGVAIFLWPIDEFAHLVYLFAIPAIIQGCVHIYAATHKNMSDHWWVLLLVGIVYMAIGVITLSLPDITPVFLMSAIALVWSFAGTMMVLLSIQLNKELENGLGLLLAGILSIMAGVFIMTNLDNDIYSILWAIVSYSFLIGALTTWFGIRAKGWVYVYFDDIME